MIHRLLARFASQPRCSPWWLLIALLVSALFPGRMVWAGDEAPTGYPSALGLGTSPSPLRIWSDEYLRMWAYRDEAEVLDPQTGQQVRAPGFFQQYYSPAGYGTYLRLTKSGEALVFTNGDFSPTDGQYQKTGSTITAAVTVDAGGIEITHAVTYNDNELVVTHQWQVTNRSLDTTYSDVALRYGGDTFFAGYDSARGYFDASTGFLYCENPDSGAGGLMGMQAGSGRNFDGYVEGEYGTVMSLLALSTVAPFPSPGQVNYTKGSQYSDNGMAVEWRQPTMAPGDSFTVVLYEKWTASGAIQVLSPVASSMQAGTQQSFMFRVQNLLASSQTLDVTVSAPSGWLATQPTTPITVAAGEVIDVPVDLVVPSAAASGAYDITVTVGDVATMGQTYNHSGTFALTIQAPPVLPAPLPVSTLPGGGSLPLSSGERTVYTAISPSTSEGKASVLAALAGSDRTITRAFAWDPAGSGSYVELPGQLPTAGLNTWTGIFIATRVALDYDLNGTSTVAPFTLDLPASGWVFAGVPPLDTGAGLQTAHPWSSARVVLGGETILDDTTTPTLAEAMGKPTTPTDSSSARPYFWNGSTYVQVDTLEAGQAYWFKNNLDQPLQVVIDPAGQVTFSAVSVRRVAAAAITVQVRDQGAPPPLPSSSSSSSASSGSGGCGSGSGIAAFSLLLLMAAMHVRFVRR